jgi:protein SEY1
LAPLGGNYKCVAVIGCQSSGKSTLLNLVFGTSFDMMDDTTGRQQTTKGIWMTHNEDKNTLILDIEGTDSKERGDAHLTFEQTTSLFALAMADVLLINMWYTDIGRNSGSNFGLLKVIFECNLKLFGQSTSKKLLYVIRDFPGGKNADAIKSLIDKDIEDIWSQIHKPEKFKNSTA